ncbi:hypothetical protein EYC80_001104 [Monilinia laxa]|uniref:Uncharacterized protein n=1 Tax=Monilinia laxa TaxID=61186 RepID=A0A5N6K8A9_MONLA|nr:hypothetical protein EYC80_001104 [Monilinia laxa]
MSPITNSVEGLAYFPSHTSKIMPAGSHSNISKTETTDQGNLGSLGQPVHTEAQRIHGTQENDENNSSHEASIPQSLTSSASCCKQSQYMTKESHQSSHSPSNSVTLDAKKQLIKTFVHELWRWLVTLYFVGILIASIRHYKSRKVLSPGQIAKFTAINVNVSIVLGLNISSALKKMALNVRWRVVSQQLRPLIEIDIFLQYDSLLGLIKAAYITRRPKVIMICLVVLLLNLTVKVSLTTLSLAYSLDSTVQHAIFKPDSQIWVTNFKSFRSFTGPKLNKILQSSIAHNRGVDGPATKSCHVSDPNCQIPVFGSTRGNTSIDYWRFDSYWQYILLEHPPYRINRSGVGYSPSGPGDLSVFSKQNIITKGCMAIIKQTSLQKNKFFSIRHIFGSPQNGSAPGMAMLIAEFAIRVFASSGYENPMVSETGRQPRQGSKLNIDNATLIHIILPFIITLYLVCLIVSALLTYRVPVPDSSPLSIANKLYQRIGLLGGRGSLLSGQEIAEVLGNPQLAGHH